MCKEGSMLKIKQFSDKQVVFVDEEGKEYVLTCKNENEKFDIDIIEDILDWPYRSKKNNEHNC